MEHLKAVFSETFVVLNAHIKKLGRSQINDLRFHLKIEKEEQVRQSKHRNGYNEYWSRNKCNRKKKMEKTNKTKHWFFENISTVNKHLTRLKGPQQ